MAAGLRTIYVDRVMGEGLTPDDFAQFKKQRRRWAQGAMQVMKGHWKGLFGPGPLSPAQRFHFVSGWLPWIGDALHLVFTFGAMAWTIGLLAAPTQFHYPITLYMLPLVVFFGFRAVLGPLLYWRRVRCSPGEILGAAVAGMGLSHAIGLGVFAGLAQREGIFEITKKGATGGLARRATGDMAGAREEVLLLAGLLVCVLGVALTREPGHLESALWLMVLGLQSLPYLAAAACAVMSMQPEAPLSPVEPGPALQRGTRTRPAPGGVTAAWTGRRTLQRTPLDPAPARPAGRGPR
jgi:hypothetical protein